MNDKGRKSEKKKDYQKHVSIVIRIVPSLQQKVKSCPNLTFFSKWEIHSPNGS